MIHESEIFSEVCIEKEYEGHTFNKCTFESCYLEVDNTKFISCSFTNCHICITKEAFDGCSISKSTTPLIKG